MKKVIMMIAVIALMAGSAYAGPNYYIGMYSAGAEHSSCGVEVASAPALYTVEFWILPGDLGLKSFAFKLDTAGDVVFSQTNSPDCSFVSGTLADGLMGSMTGCWYDWKMVITAQMYAFTTAGHALTILPKPDIGELQATDCTPGYPIHDLIALNTFGINMACTTDTEDSSWGAVKSLYK
jgi:hypothetical protein